MKLLLLGFCIYVILFVENAVSYDSEIVSSGYHLMNADGDKAKEIAEFSMSDLTKRARSERPLGLVKVLAAKSRVASGDYFNLNLLVCEVTKETKLQTFMDYSMCRTCDVTVLEKPWKNEKTVTDAACSIPADLKTFASMLR